MVTIPTTNSAKLSQLITGAVSYEAINFNYALQDALIAGRLDTNGDTAPPGSPNPDSLHVVGSSATGAWSGYDGELAFYHEGGWTFRALWEGLRLWDTDDTPLIYDGTALVGAEGLPGATWAESVASGTVATAQTSLEMNQTGLGTKTQIPVGVDVACELYALTVTSQHADTTSPPATWSVNVYLNGSGTASITESFDWNATDGVTEVTAISPTPLVLAAGDTVGFDITGTSIDGPAARVVAKFRTI